jgi:hypothetical protein
MKNYFNNTNAMNTENTRIPAVFRTADSEPHRFIRIKMDKDAMILDYKGTREYKILNAKIFVWPSDKQLRVMHFTPEFTDHYFYAALADNAGGVFHINDSECIIECYQEFLDEREKDAQGMFCIFKTECGTILITYRTADKYIGFSYAPDTPESESAAEQLYEMFEFVLPQEKNEDEDEE